LHRDLEDAGHLLGMGNQLAVVAALREELFRVGLLKVSTPDFAARNLRGDRQNGNAAAMTVVEAVDLPNACFRENIDQQVRDFCLGRPHASAQRQCMGHPRC